VGGPDKQSVCSETSGANRRILKVQEKIFYTHVHGPLTRVAWAKNRSTLCHFRCQQKLKRPANSVNARKAMFGIIMR